MSSGPCEVNGLFCFWPLYQKLDYQPHRHYTFSNGTDNSSASPVVQFLQAGMYSVKLKVSNAHGVDSMKLTNAFQAGTTIDVGINSLPSGESCFCNFDHFIAFANGATSYEWNVLPDSEDKVSLDQNNGDTVSVSLVPGFRTDSTVTVNVQVTGTQGTCSDTANLAYHADQAGE